MFESLASLLRRAAPAPASADDNDECYEEIALTDELREALFPRTEKMISTVFDRAAADEQQPAAPSPAVAAVIAAATAAPADRSYRFPV